METVERYMWIGIFSSDPRKYFPIVQIFLMVLEQRSHRCPGMEGLAALLSRAHRRERPSMRESWMGAASGSWFYTLKQRGTTRERERVIHVCILYIYMCCICIYKYKYYIYILYIYMYTIYNMYILYMIIYLSIYRLKETHIYIYLHLDIMNKPTVYIYKLPTWCFEHAKDREISPPPKKKTAADWTPNHLWYPLVT